MLNFLKNNIVVPQNATNATKTTLYQNRRFCENGAKLQNVSYSPNEYRLSCSIFFGKGLGVSDGGPDIFWPIFGRPAEISTSSWWWPTNQKSKNRFFFRFSEIRLRMVLDIESGCKMTLEHLRDRFPAIYHIPGQYWAIYENFKNSHFP